MSRRSIWIIISLMTASMLGIGLLQMLYLRWQYQLDNRQFNDKVYEALGEVKRNLETDAEIITLELLKKNNSGISKYFDDNPGILGKKTNESWSSRMKNYELKSIPSFINPASKLDNINLEKLDGYIRSALQSNGLQLAYDYGIYSNKIENFTSVNGNFVANVIGQSSEVESDQSFDLSTTPFSIPLFDQLDSDVGSLKINFPGKRTFILSSIMIPMLSSLLFTALIAFCFIYTLTVILRQKKVSEMKTDFINNMTHEFKTPIATISLASDSINSPSIIKSEDKIKRFIGIIKQENSRMLSQVEKVLQMARIDKQDFELKLEEIDIHEIVEDAIENTSLKISQKEGTIVGHLDATDSIIQGDANHIANVINNLLDNAEKYTPTAPRIEVTTYNDKSGVCIEISDNGIGMSKESQKHIFEKFYRVHTGNVHDVKGFGLGLSYVKALVEAHRGEVRVKSELDKGSTFTIKLPFNVSD